MLKVPDEADQVLVAKAYEAEQQHVFDHWDALDDAARRALLDQLRGIDLKLLKRLSRLIDEGAATSSILDGLGTDPVAPARRAELERRGWAELEAGRVACLTVAGGQGTRLGWEGPKGTFPVGPVSGKSLFALFAEQVLATGLRAGQPLRWLLLTSQENRGQTEDYFRANAWFGLDPAQVRFLVQRELPAADPAGRLILAERGRIAMSPDGHGGTLRALETSGALDELVAGGVTQLFYFQVDNPLCRVACPAFLGAHVEEGAQVSTKVVRKTDPDEKIGLVVQRNGRAAVVEYSELPPDAQRAREPDGRLVYRAGNTAIHLFDVGFLARLAGDGFELPYHVARKAVPFVDGDGNVVVPDKPNAIKFESFIFDLLPEAERHVTFEVEREEEFEPLKNKSGAYSPETVRAALSARAARWLAQAGHAPPAGARCEVSPRTALDAAALALALERGGLDLTPRDGAISI